MNKLARILTIFACLSAVGACQAGNLSEAVTDGQTSKVPVLIAHGANVNSKDQEGDTPLFDAVRENEPKLVDILLAHGADAKIKDSYGDTPLLDAARLGYAVIVETLIRHGADIEARDLAGNTPLIFAAKNDQVHLVRLFLKYGADINERNNVGYTALMSAVHEARDSSLVGFLIHAGAKVNTEMLNGTSAWTLAIEDDERTIAIQLQHAGATKRYQTLEWLGDYRSGHAPYAAVITNRANWRTIWDQTYRYHGKPLPALDFEKYVVVAVLLGDRPTGGYSIHFKTLRTSRGNLVVTYFETKPKGWSTDVLTQPYAFKVFPKPKGKIIIKKAVTKRMRRNHMTHSSGQ